MAYKFRDYICLKALDPKRSYNKHNTQSLICSYSMAKHTHTHAHTINADGRYTLCSKHNTAGMCLLKQCSQGLHTFTLGHQTGEEGEGHSRQLRTTMYGHQVSVTVCVCVCVCVCILTCSWWVCLR